MTERTTQMMIPLDHSDDDPLKVVLLGCGTVGTQVARLLTHQADDLRARIGQSIELVGISVRNLDTPREGIDPALLTTDAMGLVDRDDIDIVVELIGGIHPARELVLTAIERGSSVVTANKALLAAHGEEIFTAAENAGVDIYFEASVAGAIPIIRPLRESLMGDEITAVMGIVNGTTNYILDKMTTEHTSFDEALAQAQALGFAEADPTADVEGYDAAAKISILAGLAFHTRVSGADVYREGISKVTTADIAAAAQIDCVVKLLAIANLTDSGDISVRVHPAMVPLSHPLSSVKGAHNAVFVEAREAGQLMFLGPGAGGSPTASAVVGDIVTVARNRTRGVAGPPQSVYAHRNMADMGETITRYYLRFKVADRPGILAATAAIFAKHQVSVQNVQQSASEDRSDGWSAVIGLLTHRAHEDDLRTCLAELREADFISGDVTVMRVEGL